MRQCCIWSSSGRKMYHICRWAFRFATDTFLSCQITLTQEKTGQTRDVMSCLIPANPSPPRPCNDQVHGTLAPYCISSVTLILIYLVVLNTVQQFVLVCSLKVGYPCYMTLHVQLCYQNLVWINWNRVWDGTWHCRANHSAARGEGAFKCKGADGCQSKGKGIGPPWVVRTAWLLLEINFKSLCISTAGMTTVLPKDVPSFGHGGDDDDAVCWHLVTMKVKANDSPHFLNGSMCISSLTFILFIKS